MKKLLFVLSLLIVSLTLALPANGAGLIGASAPAAQAGSSGPSPAADPALTGLSYRYAATFGTPGEMYPETPGYLFRPSGMYMDGSDNLFVLEGSHALKFNAAGSQLMKIENGGGNGVAVDGAGNIWVVNNYGLNKFSSTGALLANYNGWESWPGQPLGFGSLWGITFDSLGRMFLADQGRHRVLVYTFSGDTPVYSATIGVDNQPGSDGGHFNSPQSVAVDSSNRLYVADSANSRIMRCSQGIGSWSCDQFTTLIGPNSASAVWISSSDLVYLVNSNQKKVLRCTLAGNCADLIDTSAYNSSAEVVADSAGNVFLSFKGDFTVRKFTSSGVETGIFAGHPGVPYLTDDQHIAAPTGIAVDGNGDIGVLAGFQLIKMKPDGTRLWAYGIAGVSKDTPGLFNPAGVNVDSNNNFYVASQLYIDIINSNGTYANRLGTGCCGGDYGFFFTQGVAVDPLTGTIYASDTGTDRVQVYNAAREYQTSIGESGVPGSNNTHLNDPGSLTVDKDGNLYIVDAGNLRIQKFNRALVYQQTFRLINGKGAEGNLVVDNQGRLFIAQGNRVNVYAADGSYLTTIGAKDLGQDQPATSFVAVDNSTGNVYIASLWNNTVVKYVPGVPEWQQVNVSGFEPSTNNGQAYAMEVFGGSLYAGLGNMQIYRLAGGQPQWQAFTPPWPTDSGQVKDLKVYGTSLYASIYHSLGGELWRTNGTTWEEVVSGGFGDATNTSISVLAGFNGSLYAVTARDDGVTQIWRSASGDAGSWTQVVVGGGFGSGGIAMDMTMDVYNGALYLGCGRNNVAELWKTSNGTDWAPVFTNGLGAANTHISAMAEFNGSFYIGMRNVTTGGSVWRSSNGSSFSPVFTNGLGNLANSRPYGLVVYDNQLYLTFSNLTNGAEVWRSTDGLAWERVAANGWGDPSNGYSSYFDKSIVVFEDYLHISGMGSGGGGQVWRYNLYRPAPAMTKVLPAQGRANLPNELHLYGTNFTAQTTVTLGTTPPIPLPVQWVVGSELIAAVPTGLTPGVYSLTVQNPHSDFSTYAGAYAVIAPAVIDLSATPFGFWTDPPTLMEGQPMKVGLNVHREGGSSPLSNVKVRFYNGHPTGGGTLIGDGTIATMGLRGDFPTSAVNWTGAAPGTYTLFAVIDPDNAVDETNENNNLIMRQVVVLPLTIDHVPPTVNSFTINNGSQQTSSTSVLLNVAASDPAPSSGIANIMYVEYAYSQGYGWIQVKNSEWLPYATSHTNYAWTLDPVAGSHYLQVWVSDRAGNRSQAPGVASINYVPDLTQLLGQVIRFYRFYLIAGRQFTATVTPTSGDPDLYVWPSSGGSPWKSDLDGLAVDTVSFTVPATGMYQVEVRAFSATTFSMTFNYSAASAGRSLQPDTGKPVPTEPMLPVTSVPEPQAGLPPAPVLYYGNIYLPMARR